MSETEGTYRAAAEPGVTALQAAAEAGWAYQALALAYMPELHKQILCGVAWMTLPPSSDIPAGWVAGRAIQKMYYPPVAHALAALCAKDLLQFDTTAGCYRLTPFGQAVAAALAGEGQ